MASLTTSFGYASWEEVLVSSEKRRRVVHYFVKKKDGSSDLAVVAKEKNFRHFSYHCALPSIASSFTLFNPKSRRNLVLWLDSLLSDLCAEDIADAETLKDYQFRKLDHCTKEFLWSGSPWICRKRRKHYQSFKRNGFKISVYDFVSILAEEDKRLIAYLEDMYEDSSGNNMVVVRWFLKIDDVTVVLPGRFCDREVLFSLYLQDLSIECIDGLATVLSPQHYEKFQNEARHTRLEPFICGNRFDNDVKPFDITQLRGYWKQEIIRYMYTLFDTKSNGSSGQSDDSQESLQHTASIRYKKRLHNIKVDCKDAVDLAAVKLQGLGNTRIVAKAATGKSPLVMVASNNLVVGSQVEVLSQDSGIRGCWFRASVIKKHKNKVKVLYQDIQDAVDGANKLEEWVLAFKISVHDDLCLRMYGRTRIRPAPPPPPSSKFEISLGVGVGSIVDAWWHDGWWEGIIVQKESEANYHVYFPGMAFEDGSTKEMQKVGVKMSKRLPLSRTSTLASMESLCLPQVQEVVLSADMQCEKCQKRVADIIKKMNTETESVVINVLGKKVILTFRLPTIGKVITEQITPINKTPLPKVGIIRRIFGSSRG